MTNFGSGRISYSASISAGSDWLSITAGASGASGGAIRVYFTQNRGLPRTGQITVMANGAGGSPTTITVTQAGVGGAASPITTPTPSRTPDSGVPATPTPTPDSGLPPTPVAGPVLSVTPGSSSVAAPSGRANLSVSNTGRGTLSYSASVSAGSDWLSITSGASGGNSGTIRIFFAQNNGIQRTGQITVMANGAGGSPTVVTITQAGRAGAPTPPSATPTPAPTVTPTPSVTPAPGPVLTVSPVSTTLAVAGGRTHFTVSNSGRGTLRYAASVSTGSNWLSITAGASGGNSGAIRVFAAANSGVPRTGQITVTANGAGGSPTTISVFQDGPVPYVPPGSGGGGAGSSGGSLSFGASTLSLGSGGMVPGDFPYNPNFPVGILTISGIQGGTIANWGTLPPTGLTLFGGSPDPTPTPTASPTPVP
ncbi:MAG: BACON domain-containing protein [Terrimicrobiaceae bacterium]